MNFILTVDTEADNQWDHGRGLTVENIKYVPRLQELCNKYHIKPTYLVTSEVCEDSFAREIFCDYIENNEAEVGAHLHSWTTPPFLNKDGYRYNDRYHAFANELPEDIVANKMRYLTDQIGTAFGKRPTSFRSGRYGFSENIAKILLTNEYLVDSSVTPYVSWSAFRGVPGLAGGPDFQDKRPLPYTYNFDGNSLLEIPVTIMPTKFPLNTNSKLTGFYFSKVNSNFFLKSLRRIFFRYQPVWLRPYPWMTLEVMNDLVREAEHARLPYLVMMFHSSELMPDCSIYRADKESIENLYELLEAFFMLLSYNGITSISLTEAAKKFEVVTGKVLSYKYM